MLACSFATLYFSTTTTTTTASGFLEGGGAWDDRAEEVLKVLESFDRGSGFTAAPIPRSGEGVIYAMGGSSDFVMQEVIPTIRYLTRLGPRSIRYALFSEKKLLSSLSRHELEPIRSWFETITTYEEIALPAFRKDHALMQLRVRVKAIKAHALLFSPFERFVFLDFDSRPCSPRFAEILLDELKKKNVDALLHNQWEDHQISLTGEAHYKIEHNSAIAVFDATTPASDAALRFFVSAFEQMRPRRDQPPLMVALRAAKRSNNFTHADVSPEVFCRRNASKTVSCDAGCLVVHKPQKYDPGHVVFAVGTDKSGANDALPKLLATLKIRNSAPNCGEDVLALRRQQQQQRRRRPRRSSHHHAVAAAAAPPPREDHHHPDDGYVDGCRVFFGSPGIAARAASLQSNWPRAKFVLTVSSKPDASELAHVDAVTRALDDQSRLFVLDLRKALRDDRIWKQFCSFLEVWSSCKTHALSAIASSWLESNQHPITHHPTW